MKRNLGKISNMIIMIIGMLCLLTGCNQKEEVKQEISTATPVPTITEELPTATPEVVTGSAVEINKHKGQKRSKLTNLWIDKSLVNKRPYAIMINNIRYAAERHSGISQASILYEAIVEGEITRLMGIFEEFDGQRIGSVRSARHYYVSIADEYDAIYVHYGHTKYALSKISELNIDTISGLASESKTVFYRDSSIRAPHNAFTTYEGLIAGTKLKGYRTEYRNNFKGFQFNKKNTSLKKSQNAEIIKLGYSNKPYFEYDKKSKIYNRYQFGTAHIDISNNKQLAFKNIIIQFVREWDIDKNGYQTMDFANSTGTGYYATNGKVIEISWKKNESTKEMHYYTVDGKELKINTGKTYIAIYPDNRTNEIQFSGNND